MSDRFHKPSQRSWKYKNDFWFRVRGSNAKRRRELGRTWKPISARTLQRQYHEYHQRRAKGEAEQRRESGIATRRGAQ